MTSTSRISFWKSVTILINKPHVVNKRLWGCIPLMTSICKSVGSNEKLLLDFEPIKYTNDIEKYKTYLLEELLLEEYKEVPKDINDVVEVIIIELLPKIYSDSHAFQLVILNKECNYVTYYDITPGNVVQNLSPDFKYRIELKNDDIVLQTQCDPASKSYQWLKGTVLPQVIKWSQENIYNVKTKQVCYESLNLVSNDKYYKKYNDLKLKYGKELVKIWPECTDPAKFVYEDIAIATYLLLLWEYENSPQQTFVDLGCGNGLLVYILIKEGHAGVGVDVRKRKIWDMYTTDVKLEEKTITPSDVSLFPKANWIIGNHSDELTPWIPVIAARSSYNCNFFLLPCCAFNFDGTKYQRHNSSKSQYTEYLEYVKKLCEKCGFKMDLDRLKIPSTKRICLIGRGRTYPIEEYSEYCKKIQNIINSETSPIQQDDRNQEWIKNFKSRVPIEKVRNCTQIDKMLIESIVDSISNYLIEGCDLDSNWSAGKVVDICDVVQLISDDKLKALKSECGGLQTLLKNNHHIFMVQSGKVQLRYPKTVNEVKEGNKNNKNKTIKLKQRLCWFYNNHPQGCPLTDDCCSFSHVKT